MSSARRALSRPSKLLSRRRKSAPSARNLLQAERLELRQLMAGDVATPYHNPWYAQDVNNDYVATPLDALLVINALNTSGPRQLTASGTGASGEGESPSYIDVNGDGYLSPIDALSIINHLNANGEAPPVVQMKVVLYGENGKEITTGRTGDGVNTPYTYTVSKDDRFGVSIQLKDLRPVADASQFGPAALGVYSMFTDVMFDPTYSSLGFSEVQQFSISGIDANDGQSQVTISVPGLGTSNAITLTDPGATGNDPAFDRTTNANNIRTALNTLSGSATNDVFRVTAAEGPSFSTIYTIKFLGDFVDRNIGLVTVTPVAGQGPITAGTVTSTFEPVNVNTIRKSVIESAMNVNGNLYKSLAEEGPPESDPDYEDDPRELDIFTTTSDPHLALIQRTGAYGGGVASTSVNPITGKTPYSPPTATPSNPDSFIELMRPYFVATNATPAGQPFQIKLDPPGYPTDDLETDALTQTLIIQASASEASVPRERVSLGLPINIIVRADVTANADTATVNEDSSDNPIDVLTNDTNNVGTGTKVITGVGADGKQTSFTVAGQGTVTFSGGALTFTPVANFFGTFTFQYGLTDTGVDPKDIGQVTITVTEVNDPPTADDDTVTVVEDSGNNVITAQLLTGDSSAPDPAASDTLKITLVNGLTTSPTSKGVVSVDSTTGVVTYTPNANASGADSFSYTLSDGRGGTATANVTINITPVNDPPSFTLGANHTSNEDAGLQTQASFVGSINPGPALANPQETDGPVTFSVAVVGTLPSTLTFSTAPAVATDGTLTYQAAANAFGTGTFRVTATDASGASSFQDFTVTVNAVNDAPEFTIPATLVKNEDVAVNEAFATGVTAGPNEGTAGVTFQVIQTNSSGNLTFTTAPTIIASGGTGTLAYTPAANTFGTATFDVIASDGSLTTTKTFTLTVNNVNDNPDAVDDPNLEVPDGDTTFLPVLANDSFAPDFGETLLVDTTVPLVFLDPVPAGVSVTVKSDGSGLDVTSPFGLITGSLRVQYTIRDRAVADANALKDTAIATLNFVSNELPRAVADNITGVAVEDSGAFVSLNVLANDRRADNTNGVLTITGIRFLPTDPLVTATGTIITDANGNQLRIAADRLSVEFQPGTNVNGNVSFNYEVNETPVTPDGTSETTSIVVVAAVNDEPSFTVGADVTRLEDAGAQSLAFATNILAGPTNESSQIVTFQVSNNNNALFSVQPSIAADGTLTFTPAPNANGTAVVSVFVTDNGGTALGGDDTSPTQIFNINITAVNDAPTFTLGANPTVAEDAIAQVFTIATNISVGPSDESAQTPVFTVENNTNTALFSVQPTVAANGQLNFTPAPDAFGTAQITLRLTDNGGTANGGADFSEQTFTITVTPVNDTPTFTVGADQTVNEDSGPASVSGFTSNVSTGAANETQALSYVVSNNNASLFAVAPAISPTGVLTYTPAANANGAATVTVQIRDDNGTPGNTADDAISAPQTFTITVNAVNDAPNFTSGSNVTVAEDSAAFNAAWATAISKGPADESGQTLTFNVSNNNNALFLVQPAINPATGNLTFTPAANANGSATVTVTLSDDGGTALGGADTSSTRTFTISVTAVNDAPSFTLPTPSHTVAEDAGAQSVASFAQNISAGPANESSQVVAFTTTNNNNSLFSVQPTIAADGTLNYTPAANANGTATVTVFIKDDNGTPGVPGDDVASASQTFVITVTAVNDPPTANDDPSVRVFKTATSYDLLNLLANDTSAPDGPETLTITAVTITSAVAEPGSPSNAGLTATVINGGTGVRFNNPSGFYGDVVLTYTISDPGGLTDTATVMLDVVNFLPGYISGIVWVDVDNDGVVDPANPPTGAERRVGGVEVYLYGQTMFGQAYSQTVTTDVNGQYAFNDPSLPNGGVIPGSYTVSLDNPNTVAIEGVELFSDGQDVNGQVTGATSTRIANNTYQIVFGENGATVANLNFGVLGLQSNYINIRDYLASSTTNGALFGANIGAATADSQQFWAMQYDGWAGLHDLKIKIAPDLSTATIEARDTNNTLFTKTLSFSADYTKIRLMGRDGNNVVVRLIGTASDFFPTADLVASNNLPGPSGEAMYEGGEGAEYAAAADAVYAEEAWA